MSGRTYTKNEAGEIWQSVRAAAPAETYTEEEVIRIGVEAGMSEAEVRAAIRRQEEAAKRARLERDRRDRQRAVMWRGFKTGASYTAMFGAVFAMIGGAYIQGEVRRLHDERAAADLARERVEAAYLRRHDVPRIAAVAHDTRELAEATYRVENRIHVARYDYDTAAAAYNRRAASRDGRLYVRFYSLPAFLPLSAQLWGYR